MNRIYCKMNAHKSLIKKIILFFLVFALVGMISLTKYKSGEINYLNSDATWHTLYTIKCYDETPISQHKFLPLVSLGRQEDKGISWGACIPDSEGNYYYTSFSPAFYTLGYLFIKLFHLSYSEHSLYILNTLLYFASCSIFAFFLCDIFKKSKWQSSIVCVGVLLYVLQPELLHGMGIVYWAQSLLQVTLIAQVYAYYRWKKYSSKKAFVLFVVLGIINPYIEWTGYVADFGFALSELFLQWKKNRFKAVVRAGETMFLAVISFVLFCIHYCSTVDPSDFFAALIARFFGRNFMTTSVSIKSLITGYVKSFYYTWILLLVVLILYCVVRIISHKEMDGTSEEINIISSQKYLVLVTLIPVLENFVMKEHAVSYTYDRMKLIFPIAIIICGMVNYLLYAFNKKWVHYTMCFCVLVVGILNYHSYANNEMYRWTTDYREDNEILAQILSQYREDSVYGFSGSVRGYVNLTFHTGCYELTDMAKIRNLANEKGKRYAVILNSLSNATFWDMYESSWGIYDFAGATIYDSQKNEYIVIEKNNHNFEQRIITGYETSSMTDNNWTNGISKSGSTVLLPRYEKMLEELSKASEMYVDDYSASITNFDFDNSWIRVTIDGDATRFAYPSYVNLR